MFLNHGNMSKRLMRINVSRVSRSAGVQHDIETLNLHKLNPLLRGKIYAFMLFR